MARPFKKGLSYFPFEVGFFDDPKIRQLSLKSGYLGVLMYIRILTLVYSNGYYLEMDKDALAECLFFDFRSQWVRSVERVSDIILCMLQCKLLDKHLLDIGVITSSSIQKQYILSTARRRIIEKKYWLLTPEDEAKLKILKNDSSIREECVHSEDSETETLVNVTETEDIVAISTQNKKENKNKKKRDKDDKLDKGLESQFLELPFTPNYYLKCLIRDGIIDIYYPKIYEFNELFKNVLDAYKFEDITNAFKYLRNYLKRPSVKIDDMYDFFKASFIRNLDWLSEREEREAKWEDEWNRIFEELRKNGQI